MKMERAWAMPSANTFNIEPISDLIDQECLLGFEVFPHGPKIDVLSRIRACETNDWDSVLLDPPFSPRQAKQCYQLDLDAVEFASLITVIKDEMARIIKPGGKAVCFGWNSNGLGKGRGFELKRVLLVAHGGHHNDTIVTVERKVNGSLSFSPEER